MKRKLVMLLLTAALTASLAGCGGGAEESAPAPAASAETKTEDSAKEEEKAADSAKEEEKTEDSSESSGTFSLLDVDENMIDVGVYGNDSDGTELVFSMFTGPDGKNYVSLFGFDNKNNSGDVICGQYEASTEKDEDGDDWTYFDVTDVYTGDHFNLGVCERAETEEIAFFDKSGNVVEGKYLSAAETINYMGSAAGLLMNGGDSSSDSADSGKASDIKYVDGFYANSGNDDFMIFFYESSDGDMAYVNDGTNEAFAEYTVENAKTDDGTDFLLVTVGKLKLGYLEDGDDIYIVTDDGTTYAAGRLTEAEAEELHSIVND